MKVYIEFDIIAEKPKTMVWAVRNISSQVIIGYIKWYPAWRQYCFFPEADTIFSVGCLNDINKFIINKMNLRKNEK